MGEKKDPGLEIFLALHDEKMYLVHKQIKSGPKIVFYVLNSLK